MSAHEFLLVDGSGLYWQQWFARGDALDAMNDVLELLSRHQQRRPVIWCADGVGEQCFRKRLYPEYKAQRKPDSRPPSAWEGLQALESRLPGMHIPVLRHAEYEADDVIATLVRWIQAPCIIMSRDKDLVQLADDRVRLCAYAGTVQDARDIENRWGIPPKLFAKYLAICGDQADNVPGCPGVGPKKARQLLEAFGDICGISAAAYSEAAGELPGVGPKIIAAIRDWDWQLSLKLVSLSRHVPLNAVDAAVEMAITGHEMCLVNDDDDADGLELSVGGNTVVM